MIVTIFIILLVISLFTIIAGKFMNAPPVSLAGYLFLFILGLVLMLGGLSYKVGATESYNYVCSCCESGTYKEGTTQTVYICAGLPNSCDAYDNNQLDCIASGCSFDSNTSLCTGEPSDCDSYSTSRECELVGCTWTESEMQPSTCENSSTLTIKNITTTEVYSSYDSEIFSGILVNHVFGFFLCILAVFGFVIVLINLESFQEVGGNNKGSDDFNG
jgi:hypothetical protein